MRRPRFLVNPDALSHRQAVLTGPELHHLRVRRLQVGHTLFLTDGRGAQRRGVIAALDRHRAIIDLTDEPDVHRESALSLVLAQALLKADALDLVIRKATELGVSDLVLFTSTHTAAHVGMDRQSRWSRLAESAAKQCQRSTVPTIIGPLTFDAALAFAPNSLRILFWEECRAASLAALKTEHPRAAAVLAFVGPEGGFSAAEAACAAAAGCHLTGLGARILRAETASIVAIALAQFLWGDLGGIER